MDRTPFLTFSSIHGYVSRFSNERFTDSCTSWDSNISLIRLIVQKILSFVSLFIFIFFSPFFFWLELKLSYQLSTTAILLCLQIRMYAVTHSIPKIKVRSIWWSYRTSWLCCIAIMFLKPPILYPNIYMPHIVQHSEVFTT